MLVQQRRADGVAPARALGAGGQLFLADADNRRVRFDYFVEETFEAGLALQGTEVKALRAGEASIKESYAEVRDGQVWLVNANIPEYSHGNRLNHEPRRPRKLLLNPREIEKLFGAVERKGMTLVPLSVYFNSTGRAKVELALAKGDDEEERVLEVEVQLGVPLRVVGLCATA